MIAQGKEKQRSKDESRVQEGNVGKLPLQEFSPELGKGRLLTQMGSKRSQEDILVNISRYRLAPQNSILGGRLQTQVKSEMLAPHTRFRIHALGPRICVCHRDETERENVYTESMSEEKEGGRKARLSPEEQDRVRGAPSAFSRSWDQLLSSSVFLSRPTRK